MSTHVTFPAETERELKRLSEQYDVPITSIIRSLVYEGLARQPVTLSPAAANHIRALRRIRSRPAGEDGPEITFVNDDPNGASTDQPLHPNLGDMVEAVVARTGISININSSVRQGTGTSNHYRARAVDINRVNGRRVDSFSDDPQTRALVSSLQEAFQQHGHIRENFGPALQLKVNSPGSSPVARSDQAAAHRNHIHIACQV